MASNGRRDGAVERELFAASFLTDSSKRASGRPADAVCSSQYSLVAASVRPPVSCEKVRGLEKHEISQRSGAVHTKPRIPAISIRSAVPLEPFDKATPCVNIHTSPTPHLRVGREGEKESAYSTCSDRPTDRRHIDGGRAISLWARPTDRPDSMRMRT